MVEKLELYLMTLTHILILKVPSHILMGIPHIGEALPLTPFGDACLRKDMTAMHEFLEKLGYKDDEGAATEVLFRPIVLHATTLMS